LVEYQSNLFERSRSRVAGFFYILVPMKKIFLTILLIASVSITHAQRDTSTKAQLQKLETHFRQNNDRLTKTNDSLQRELLYYKAKDDYYSTALSDQSTRFATIVGAIIGLAALFGFGWFQRLVTKINENRGYIDDVAKDLTIGNDKSMHRLLAINKQNEIERHTSTIRLYRNITDVFQISHVFWGKQDPITGRLIMEDVSTPRGSTQLKFLLDILRSTLAINKEGESSDLELGAIESCIKAINEMRVNFKQVDNGSDIRILPVSRVFRWAPKSMFDIEDIIDANSKKELIEPLYHLKRELNSIMEQIYIRATA